MIRLWLSKTRRRKSPKRGKLEHVFLELVSLPRLLIHANFSIEILFIQEEEIRWPNTRRGWHRKAWVTHERRLMSVLGQRLFESPADFAAMIPETLAGPFSTADLATTLSIPHWLAQKMAYCLHVMNAIQVAGKKGNAVIYKRAMVGSGNDQ